MSKKKKQKTNNVRLTNREELTRIMTLFSTGHVSTEEAVDQIVAVIEKPITAGQMDAFTASVDNFHYIDSGVDVVAGAPVTFSISDKMQADMRIAAAIKAAVKSVWDK